MRGRSHDSRQPVGLWEWAFVSVVQQLYSAPLFSWCPGLCLAGSVSLFPGGWAFCVCLFGSGLYVWVPDYFSISS